MSKAAITVEAFIDNELSIRDTPGGHRVLDVSLPHTPSRKNPTTNEWEDAGPTNWYQATFWDEYADAMLMTVEKGTLVIVSGFPELETYMRNDNTAGGKVLIKFPTLAVVVRKPRTGAVKPAEEPWAAPSGEADNEQPKAPGDDVWNTPGTYNDETPF